MSAPKVLLVVAHPVIASGIETLLHFEGEYELRRVSSIVEAAAQRGWGADAVLVDGTLLTGHANATLGAPAYVLSGSERDGRQLARRLDDGRGWLRKDATGPELARAIDALMQPAAAEPGLGTLGMLTIAVLCLVVLALVGYLVWLAMY